MDERIKKSGEFVLDNLSSDFLWRDFRTNSHGVSIDWASGIIGSQITENLFHREFLIPVADALAKRQYSDGGWAYYNGENQFYENNRVEPDVDSTSWVAYFLSKFGKKYSKNLSHVKDFLLKHQNSSGSFSTYTQENLRKYRRIPKENSVEGWCGEHSDVTAQTIFALDKIGEDTSLSENYLIKSQESDGRIRSYWWTNDIYSTALSCEIIQDRNFLKKTNDWLGKQNTEIPFYVALQLRGFIAIGKNEKKMKTLADFLLETQNSDGSWKSYPCLRIPHPSNKTPWKSEDKWREEVTDQNKLVTTAFCFNALNKYFS